MPTTPEQMSPTGKPHLSGATSNTKNVVATSPRTNQSVSFICDKIYIRRDEKTTSLSSCRRLHPATLLFPEVVGSTDAQFEKF
jgi:hypothetical protein